jgi:hypothetical protein
MAKDKQPPDGGGHVDADKIGGTAQRHPDWGKQYPSDPATAGDKPVTRDERGGKPKSS